MKYDFRVGDYVEDVTGRTGYINSICQCADCEARGFYEPHVIYTDGDSDYITAYEYEKGFPSYKRIGQYEFAKKDEDKIEPFQVNTALTEYASIFAMSDKINELVKAVNELRAAQKGG